MKFTKRFELLRGYQDGAVCRGLLFRFNSKGHGFVADLANGGSVLGEFDLDGGPAGLIPHSNAVMFGAEKAYPDDEFPLLYSNMYNNCAACEDRREGVLLCYRVFRTADGFSSRLWQAIRVGFVENRDLWKSLPETGDVRPYGNFVIDRDARALWAFVMRNGTDSTRFFRFALPGAHDGAPDPAFGVPAVTLGEEDVLDLFDTPFMRYMQGATMKDGKIWSVEGFTPKPDVPNKNPAALRVIDTAAKKEILRFDLCGIGLEAEPEMIDFDGDTLYYGNHGSDFYTVELP